MKTVTKNQFARQYLQSLCFLSGLWESQLLRLAVGFRADSPKHKKPKEKRKKNITKQPKGKTNKAKWHAECDKNRKRKRNKNINWTGQIYRPQRLRWVASSAIKCRGMQICYWQREGMKTDDAHHVQSSGDQVRRVAPILDAVDGRCAGAAVDDGR